MLILVWFERSFHPAQVSGRKLSGTIKADDVTSDKKEVDRHRWLWAVQGRIG